MDTTMPEPDIYERFYDENYESENILYSLIDWIKSMVYGNV